MSASWGNKSPTLTPRASAILTRESMLGLPLFFPSDNADGKVRRNTLPNPEAGSNGKAMFRSTTRRG